MEDHCGYRKLIAVVSGEYERHVLPLWSRDIDLVKTMLDELSPRQAETLRLRFGLCDEKPYTLKMVGEKIGITASGVRLHESNALRQLMHSSRIKSFQKLTRPGVDEMLKARDAEITKLKEQLETATQVLMSVKRLIEEERIPVIHKELTPILTQSVFELPMSSRTYNCVKNCGMKTFGDLVTKTEAEMLHVKNFGRKSLSELKALLEPLGLGFGMKIAV